MAGIINPNAHIRGLILVSRRVGYTASRGEYVVDTWEGSPASVMAEYANVRRNRPDVDVQIDDSGGVTWQLITQMPDIAGGTQAEQTENWELLGNDIQRDIYEHPSSLSIPEDDIKAIRAFMADPVPNSSPALSGNANAVDLFNLLLRGVTSYVSSQYVLRSTNVLPRQQDGQLAFTGIEKVWTTVQLNALDRPPSAIMFSIANIPEATPRTGYTWGWLKKSPTVSQVSGNRFQISQEYWLEQWSNYLYAPFTS